MSRYRDEEESFDGRSRTSSLTLPASQRLSLSNDPMSMMMFFGRAEDMLLKSSLSEGANVLRDGVMPSYMESYLDLFSSDSVILQATGSGPSCWSSGPDDLSQVTIRSYRSSMEDPALVKSSRPKGKARERAKESESVEVELAPQQPKAPKASAKSKRRGNTDDRSDLELMSPPAKASSKSAESSNLDRILEAQQTRIRELTILAQDAKIRELELELHNSKSGRAVADKFHDRNATSLLSTFREIIARVRGNIDASLLCVLDNSPEYVDAEKSHDLIRWWITLREKTLFSSLSKVQFVAGLDSALSSKKNAYFNLALSKVSFAELATRFIVAFKAFKLADDKITEARMVDYLIDNISGEGIENTRTRIRGAAIFDSEAVAAQSSLSHAIELITKGIFLHSSLQTTANPFEKNRPAPSFDVPPPTDGKTGGAAEQQLGQAVIMKLEGMSARLEQVASQVKGSSNRNKVEKKNKEPFVPTVTCSRANRCRWGDGCRFIHSINGKPDHRLDRNGAFKPEFMPNMGKRLGLDKDPTIFALKAENASLKAAAAAKDNASPNLFGFGSDGSEHE